MTASLRVLSGVRPLPAEANPRMIAKEAWAEEHLLEKWLKVLKLSESWSPSHLISRLGGRERRLRVIGRFEGVSLSEAVRQWIRSVLGSEKWMFLGEPVAVAC
jgi:hypothetical protein